MGQTEFVKKQKKDLADGQVKKIVKEFKINERAAEIDPLVYKNKHKAPEGADNVHDAEAYEEMLRNLTGKYKILMEEAKQSLKNC